MTKELRKALEILFANIGKPKKILEIGSRPAVNQEELCNLRSLFPNSEYVGVDMEAGDGVDVVADAVKLPFADHEFDLVLCLETLEHTEKPWLVTREIERVSKTEGIVILSSQQNFPIHLHPMDYFRYTPYGLRSLMVSRKNSLTFTISPPFDDEVLLNPKHVVSVSWNGKRLGREALKNELLRRASEVSIHKPYRHRLQDAWKLIRRAWDELGFRQEIAIFDEPTGSKKK